LHLCEVIEPSFYTIQWEDGYQTNFRYTIDIQNMGREPAYVHDMQLEMSESSDRLECKLQDDSEYDSSGRVPLGSNERKQLMCRSVGMGGPIEDRTGKLVLDTSTGKVSEPVTFEEN
jgi:hypothetical protein